MTSQEINRLLASRNAEALACLNHWATKTVRGFCWDRDYNAAILVREETARINVANMGLEEYLRCNRSGSSFLLSRAVRRAVWALEKSRAAYTAALN